MDVTCANDLVLVVDDWESIRSNINAIVPSPFSNNFLKANRELGFAHDLCQRKLGVIVTLSKANASGDVSATKKLCSGGPIMRFPAKAHIRWPQLLLLDGLYP